MKFLNSLMLSIFLAAAQEVPPMPSAVLMPTPKVYFTNNNGAPCGGCKLWSYAAGLSTLQDTYTDNTAGPKNTNPIVLDSYGRASVWLAGLSYKFVLEQAPFTGGGGHGTVLWTQDNVSDTTFYYIEHLKFVSDSQLLSYRVPNSPTGSVIRVLRDKLGESVSVGDFGAQCDGTTNDSAAFQAAADAMATGGTIIIPPGICKLVTGIVSPYEYVIWRGAGQRSTTIDFEPTADATAFTIGPVSSSHSTFQSGIEGVNFTSSDTAHKKVAVSTVDLRHGFVRDVSTYPWTDVSKQSTAIETHGREVNEFINLRLAADQPIHIMKNPNYVYSSTPGDFSGPGSEDADHYHFMDCTLIGDPANAAVLIDPGVNIGKVTFDGFQAWVSTKYGLYWYDHTAPGASQIQSFYFAIHNVRFEGAHGLGGWDVYIDHAGGAVERFLLIDNFFGSADSGYYFRNVYDIHIVDCLSGNTGVALNVDSSVSDISVSHYHLLNGNTVVNTGAQSVSWTDTNGAYTSAAVISGDPLVPTPVPFTGTDGAAGNTSYQMPENIYLAGRDGTFVPQPLIGFNGHVRVDPLGFGTQFGGGTYTFGDAQTIGAANTLSGHSYFVPVAGVPKARWVVSGLAGAESGSEAGSNFQILRYSDAGVFVGTAFQLNRKTGVMTLEVAPSLPGGVAGKAMCWKADNRTPGYCSSAPDAGGACTCN